MIAYTLELSAEIKVVPAQSDTDSVRKPRQCAVSYLHTVVCVEFSVAVGVTIKEVTEFRTLVCCKIVRILIYE